MEGGGWRPAGTGETVGAVDGGASAEWRSQLQPEARQRIVNKIMEMLERLLPISVPEGINELKKIAVRFEEKIYTTATSQSDYLRKISLKMLSMETKTQTTAGINPSPSNVAVGNQNTADSASLDSTAQTGHAGGVDWQEEIYQKIKSMKELYLAELNELNQKLTLKLQQHENVLRLAKQSEQYKKMENFKFILERSIALLQLPKNNIQLGLREKLPLYEKQIVQFLSTIRSKKIAPQPQVQQQFQQPSEHALAMSQQQPSQVSQLQQQAKCPRERL